MFERKVCLLVIAVNTVKMLPDWCLWTVHSIVLCCSDYSLCFATDFVPTLVAGPVHLPSSAVPDWFWGIWPQWRCWYWTTGTRLMSWFLCHTELANHLHPPKQLQIIDYWEKQFKRHIIVHKIMPSIPYCHLREKRYSMARITSYINAACLCTKSMSSLQQAYTLCLITHNWAGCAVLTPRGINALGLN